MPKSPSVNFKIENNNVQQPEVMLGVSAILARTTKGPFNDPSKLITSVPQFNRLFGNEIVPDGSPSNIEKALSLGSKLRIIRVPGSGYYKGILHPSNTSVPESDEDQTPSTVISIGLSSSACVNIGFYTKIYDQPVDGADTFLTTWFKEKNTIYYKIQGYNSTTNTTIDTVAEINPVITYKDHGTQNPTTSVDYIQFNNFLHNSEYLEPVFISSSIEGVNSLDALVQWLADNLDGSNQDLYLTIGSYTIATQAITSRAIPGYSGAEPTSDQWIESLDYLRDYTDPYRVTCSHIHQHLTTTSDQLAVHAAAKALVDEVVEFSYIIEVPKSSAGVPMKGTDIKAWINTCLGTVGNSMFVHYFAGGIQYYNNQGLNVPSDIAGTVLGIADSSNAKFGPWKSFVGMNRGVIYDGNGPVSPNYGVSSRYNQLNELAMNYANMVVVKDTANEGKQTMLWHGFTSQVKQDSFRFISVLNLVLFLKKYLRPILESKIEEPNIWNTWKDLYLTVKPTLDDLVTREAMSEYTWLGDQDATKYEDLVVNTEAGVRNGKYKAILRFKEIVPMQDIDMILSIDKTANTSAITLSNE